MGPSRNNNFEKFDVVAYATHLELQTLGNSSFPLPSSTHTHKEMAQMKFVIILQLSRKYPDAMFSQACTSHIN